MRVFLFRIFVIMSMLVATAKSAEAKFVWTRFNGSGFDQVEAPSLFLACKDARDQTFPIATRFVRADYRYNSAGVAISVSCKWSAPNVLFEPSTPAELICEGSELSDESADGCGYREETIEVCRPDQQDRVGNPVSVSSGNKRQVEIDFASGRLPLERRYDSAKRRSNVFGANWSTDYHRSLMIMSDTVTAERVSVELMEGSPALFKLVSGNYVPVYHNQATRTDVDWTLTQKPDGFTFKDISGRIDQFDATGRLVSVEYPGGAKMVMTHTGSNLTRIANATGGYLDFQHDSDGLITQISNEAGDIYTYAYPPVNLNITLVPADIIRTLTSLERVTMPDDTPADATDNPAVTYHYEDPEYGHLLTGITDENGVRYATWTYDAKGRANSSQHAGSQDTYSIAYDDVNRSRTVTNPLGKNAVYDYDLRNEALVLETLNGEASSNCPADIRSYSYNADEHVTQTVDRNGNLTNFTRDVAGRETSRVEASGTPAERAVITEWNTSIDKPARITSPKLVVEFTYDGQGNVLSRTETTTDGETREWAYGYQPFAGADGSTDHLLTTIDGPLPGDADQMSYAYQANGNLASITNELGHVTDILTTNDRGQPTLFEDPNGVQTALAYNARGWLTSIVHDTADQEATTLLSYDDVGQITQIIQPAGETLLMSWTPARRLSAIENALGERMDFAHDAMGNMTQQTLTDPGGSQRLIQSFAFDELGRIMKIIGAQTQETDLSYDLNDNVTEETDPRGSLFFYAYDGLDRLIEEVDPLGATTNYALSNQTNDRNPLDAVTDARAVTTNYVRNDFGEVIREVSLETGTTEYVRDERGLITQMTDGRGIVSNYVYDAAGRLLTVSYPTSPADDITYAYDAGPFSIGELTAVTENFGTTSYTYNSLGHMSGKTRSILGQSYTTLYTRNRSGHVISMTYPSGRVISFERDLAARITKIEATDPDTGVVTTLAGGITYAPYGPMTGMAMGDGVALSITYDQDYRAVSLARTGASGALMDIGFEYDAVGDITAMNDNVRPDRSQSFTYDPVSRLITASGGYGAIDYDYNLGGDRTQRTWTQDGATQIEDHAYDSLTARLMTVSLTDAAAQTSIKRQFGYTSSGQVNTDERTDNGVAVLFDYGVNARGRISSVSVGGTHLANYTYDEGEQRIAKASGSDLIHYHYDDEGRLIAESDGHTGATLRDYVWLGLTPIAVIATEEVTNETGPCDEELITALEAELAAANSAADVIEAEIADQQVTAQFRQDKVDEMYAQLDTVSGNRRDALERRIERWEDKIATLDSQIELLTLDLADIYNQIGQIETALTEARNNCDGGGGPTLEAGTYYLHADHLGKPQFATDSTGATVWDGGITTPFGEGVALAGAFAQNLMFPGQYADLETAANNNTPLFHNWHRTYDPTLGRYLQSDPIGLAGGINRYAYVGGNPVSFVDPRGEAAAAGPLTLCYAGPLACAVGATATLGILAWCYYKCDDIVRDVDTLISSNRHHGVAPVPRVGESDCGAGGDDYCERRFQHELNLCIYRRKIFQPGCRSRASNRRNLCNSGVPEGQQPPPWSIRDER